MRLAVKFFLCASVVISAALLLSGYFLITFSYEGAISRETERAVNQFQYDKFTIQAGLLENKADFNEEIPRNLLIRLASELSGLAAFFTEDRTLLYSDIPGHAGDHLPVEAASPAPAGFFLPVDIPDNSHVVQMQTPVRIQTQAQTQAQTPTQTQMQAQTQKPAQMAGDVCYVTVSGKITQSGVKIYLLVATDISGVIAQKEQMMRSFARIYFLTLIFSMAVILMLSIYITRPIKRMNKAASGIARGSYGERLPVSGGDEIGELSESFNIMACAVESKMRELVENARQKEDFAASFAHELKTPLTSVIGYADMLYQKTLSSGQVRDAALYILNEGLRLEALSLKLMELIVLNRRDFVLEEMRADELLSSIAGGLKLVLEEKNVTLHLNVHPAYIMVEYDLFKTLLLNLIDNAIKAGCGKIVITGRLSDAGEPGGQWREQSNRQEREQGREQGREQAREQAREQNYLQEYEQTGRFPRNGESRMYYSISVADNGRGMPESELARITEAFYTVDKSRSRKQHGAGLGLALAERIAGIHGSSLEFSSREGVGTVVKISLVKLHGQTVPRQRNGLPNEGGAGNE